MTPVRTSKRASKALATLRRRSVAALVALLAAVSGALIVTAPAVAGPVDVGWSAVGPGILAGGSDGAQSAASFSYNADGNGSGVWDFTATATPASAVGPINVPWTWSGLHAWFLVTAHLDLIVDGQVVGTLLDEGPEICCTTPSNGFLYGGVATFDIPATPGTHTYGFRLSGTNSDYNNFLRGTFTLSTQPYLDATIGDDNRDWPGAQDIGFGPYNAAGRATGSASGSIGESGEARWYRFDVDPGQDVDVTLSGLTKDYDLALYGDVETAFDQLVTGGDVAQLASAASAAAPGAQSQVPQYDSVLTDIPTLAEPPTTSQQYAPRVYAPRVYAPRVYAPRVYAPRVYAPRVYAPRVYAPGSYLPANITDTSFSDAFSGAQNQTLVAVSANIGSNDETVSASTGNTSGSFFVRVQGHTDQAFGDTPFTLTVGKQGDAGCAGVSDLPADPASEPQPTAAQANVETLIVTDTNNLGLDVAADRNAYLASLDDLAGRTGGAVIDVAGSQQVRDLWAQVGLTQGCPYAVNLVAAAIKEIADDYRNPNTQYVVIAGGDDVVPFFRYPDVSGLGQESQFVPPVQENSPAGASLKQDQVQSQDAYGSDTSVTIGGSTLPLPDLAVGRLVKTPAEIGATIANFVDLGPGGVLPTPDASLVTGYDFLADAADAVGDEFAAAIPGAGNDRLISPAGTPLDQAWTGAQLEQRLLGSHHDLVYLAGHFSANDTLAADFATTFDADHLDPAYVPDPAQPLETNADKLKNTLVLSAGCHSGYNIVDGAATSATNTFDWTQRMAQQKAVLIGGTGYQYGDTDFLEYSERLYLDIARRLHEGDPAAGASAPAIAVGVALALAKQDYLASLSTLSGIDQKAVLEATLYGLPMTGFDAPARSRIVRDDTEVSTTQVPLGTPGRTYGLQTADLPVVTANQAHTKTDPVNPDLTWFSGPDGVAIQPGAPALPKQIKDVTVAGQVLRGVGFRSGTYTDQSGRLPLTGAPAIEGSTPNGNFSSAAFWPQRLATANYFGALGSSGRTSLVLTPAQYRSDDGGANPNGGPNTARNYESVDTKLFYTPANAGGAATLAAAPGISAVKATMAADGVVTFSVRAAGDPAAGVQEVWVTWTGAKDNQGKGRWTSVDLIQDVNDSTLWTGTSTVDGQSAGDLRFLVQAANGAGAVGLDTAEGDGYRVGLADAVDTADIALAAGVPSSGSPYGVSALVTDADGIGIPGRTVQYAVSRGATQLYTYFDLTGDDGSVPLQLDDQPGVPPGVLTITASVLGDAGQVLDTATLVLDSTRLTLQSGAVTLSSPLGVSATARDLSGQPVAGRSVRFVVTRGGVELYRRTVTTGSTGIAVAPLKSGYILPPAGEIKVLAELLDPTGQTVQHSTSITKTIAGVPVAILSPTPDQLVARAGQAYAVTTSVSATVWDLYGTVPSYPVTFAFPASGASATFTPQGGPTTRTLTIATGADGKATVPATTVITAATTVGSFSLAIGAPSTISRTIPFAAQYGTSAFVSPTSSSPTTTATGTTSVKIAALLASGAKVSDSEGAALVSAGRVQIRWRQTAPTSSSTWVTSNKVVVSYDKQKDLFQSDLKASTVGWVQGRTYLVELRFLAAGSSQPGPVLQSSFDLGSRSFTLKVI